MAAVEYDLFGGDFVRAVSVAGIVVTATGHHGWLAVPDRKRENRPDVRVHVVACVVDVDGFAGQQDRGSDLTELAEKPFGIEVRDPAPA